jgi:hypothetical protein
MPYTLDVDDICRHAKIVPDPSYYSGRGATTSDLNDSILQRAHDIIRLRLGDDAAAAYVRMVASLPVASATGFLRGLYDLSASNWHWPESKPGHDDIYAGNEGSGLATIVAVMSRPRGGEERDAYEAEQRQRTAQIRGAFLSRNGMKDHSDARGGGYGWMF